MLKIRKNNLLLAGIALIFLLSFNYADIGITANIVESPVEINNFYNFNEWKNNDFNAVYDVNFGLSDLNIAKYSIDRSPWYDFNFITNIVDNDYNLYIPITIDGNHKIRYWFKNNSNVDSNSAAYNWTTYQDQNDSYLQLNESLFVYSQGYKTKGNLIESITIMPTGDTANTEDATIGIYTNKLANPAYLISSQTVSDATWDSYIDQNLTIIFNTEVNKDQKYYIIVNAEFSGGLFGFDYKNIKRSSSDEYLDGNLWSTSLVCGGPCPPPSDTGTDLYFFVNEYEYDYNYAALDTYEPEPLGGIDGNSGGWKNYDFNIFAYNVDFGPSGKQLAKYNIDGGPFYDLGQDGNDYYATIVWDANHEVIFWFRNEAGTDTNFLLYALSDKNAPIVAVYESGLPWHNQDFNIWFDVNFDPSGDKNSMYKLDGGGWRSFGVPFITTDGWEDGTVASKFGWNAYSGSAAVSSDVKRAGVYSLALNGGVDTTTDLNINSNIDIDYTFWVRTADVTSPGAYVTIATKYGVNNFPLGQMNIQNGKFRIGGSDTGVSADINTWYKFVFTYKNQDSVVYGKVYNESGILLVEDYFSPHSGPDDVNVFYMIYGMQNNIYIDDVSYTGQMDGNVVVPIDIDGNHTIDFNFTDNANNSTYGIVQALYDATAPVIGGVINAATWIASPFNLILTGVTDVTSGVFNVWVSENGGSYNDANIVDTNVYIPVTNDGNNIYDVWIQDNAGNDTNATYYAYLDSNGPDVLSIDGNGLPWNNNNFIISFDVNFDPSGESNSVYRLNDSTWTDFNTGGVDANLHMNDYGSDSGYIAWGGGFGYKFTANKDIYVTNIQHKAFVSSATNETISIYSDSSGTIGSLLYSEDWNNINGDVNSAVDGATLYQDTNYWIVFSATTSNNINIQSSNVSASSSVFTGDYVHDYPSSTTYDFYDTKTPKIRFFGTNLPGKFLEVITDGNNVIDYNFTNTAGNFTYNTTYGLLDKTAPTYISIVNPGTSWQTIDFNIIINDVNFDYSGKFVAKCDIDGGGFIDMNFVGNDYYCAISTDGNHVVSFWLRDNAENDTNASMYSAFDSTAPTVGSTVITPGTGGVVYGAYFRGVVNIIGGLAEDSVSGINTTTCEYDVDGSWTSATWNTNHCEISDINVGLIEKLYGFNTRIYNNAGLLGTGTAGNYMLDRNAPQTSAAANWIDRYDRNIVFDCVDSQAGCKEVYYSVDSGAWTSVSAPTTWVTINTPILGLHNIKFYALDNLDNNELTQYGMNSTDYNIFGQMRIRVRDENTTLDLNDVIMTLGVQSYTINSNILIDLNEFPFILDLNDLESDTYSMMFTKIDYGTRYYDFDLNNTVNYDINFLMLGASRGSNRSFKMYDYDQITALPGSYTEFIRTDQNSRVNEWLVGRRYANEDAEFNQFISITDSNYDQNILFVNGDTNRFNPVRLRILHPKDEISYDVIDGNWDFDFESILFQFGRDINGDYNVFILPNTNEAYAIEFVDSADAYFERTYSLIYEGNPLTAVLQPYLVSSTDGEVIRFITRTPAGTEVPGVTIEIYKTTPGGRELFGSHVTDSSGSVATALIASGDYDFEFYYNGNNLTEGVDFSLQIVATTYYITINNLEYVSEIPQLDAISVVFTPNTERIEDSVTSVSQYVDAQETADVNFILFQYMFDNNKQGKYVVNYNYSSCNMTCDNSFLLTNPDLNLYKPFYVDVNIITDVGESLQIYHHRYVTASAIEGFGIDIVNLFVNAKADFGCSPDWFSPCPLTTLLVIIIAIMATGGLMFKFGWSNPYGLTIFGGMIVAIGTAVGWFYLPLLILLIIVSVVGQLSKEVKR